jgi:cold shock CspA family protein
LKFLNVHTGILKMLNRQRGFGFIKPDGEAGADNFVHFRDLQQSGVNPDSLVDG